MLRSYTEARNGPSVYMLYGTMSAHGQMFCLKTLPETTPLILPKVYIKYTGQPRNA